MRPLRLLRALRHQLRLTSCGGTRLRHLQDQRLHELVTYAYQHSDFYRERFDAAALKPDAIQGIDDLARIPVTDKNSLKCAPREQLLSRDAELGPLVDERSSGSTGAPFAVAFDRGYLLNRNLRFLRGLWAAGYRWPMKLLLITGAREKPPSRWLRWHYASIKADAAQSLQTLMAVRPTVLYGCVTPLRELAQLLLQRGEMSPILRSVITTAETLDEPTRQLLKRAFRCDVFDFYGMTEMGLVGWECHAHDGYHLAVDSIVVEQLPLADESGNSQLVYTNLALRGMPLLRYASGDIGYGYTEARCRCGSHFPRLQRIEGRLVDVVELADGRRCSPYQFTCELERIEGLYRYKVVQEAMAYIRVIVQASPATPRPQAELEQEIAATIRRVTDALMEVRVEMVAAIPHEPGTKFRIVENRVKQPALPVTSN